MATVQKHIVKTKSEGVAFGLLANGSSGVWQIDVDEALVSGPERWSMQIEGPSASLYFDLPSTQIVKKMARFLAPKPSKGKRHSNGLSRQSSELVIGSNGPVSVRLIKDDEFDDRFFLLLALADGVVVQFVITGTDLVAVTEALRQVLEDLEDNT